MRPVALPAAIAAACLALTPAAARNIYKWVDEDGIVHYTDRAPDESIEAEVERIRVVVEPKPLARLAIDRGQGSYRARAQNLIHGALEVELAYQQSENVDSRPALPARHVLPAMGDAVVAELFPADARRPGHFTLALRAIPGRPGAVPEDIPYRLPVGEGAWHLAQGFGGSFSHNDPQSRYAIDLAVEEGTAIVAARGGVVMQVESDFDRSGLDRERFAGRANHIRIEHEDGTMALYAHLQPGGTLVRPGQRVEAGQLIGYSGNTGFSSGPHLHFAVQVNVGMELVSIPFRMGGPAGEISLQPH